MYFTRLPRDLPAPIYSNMKMSPKLGLRTQGVIENLSLDRCWTSRDLLPSESLSLLIEYCYFNEGSVSKLDSPQLSVQHRRRQTMNFFYDLRSLDPKVSKILLYHMITFREKVGKPLTKLFLDRHFSTNKDSWNYIKELVDLSEL